MQFKQIKTLEELKEFKYSGYILFKKELYKKEHIDEWLEWMKDNISVTYLNKPFPHISIIDKIEIKESL